MYHAEPHVSVSQLCNTRKLCAVVIQLWRSLLATPRFRLDLLQQRVLQQGAKTGTSVGTVSKAEELDTTTACGTSAMKRLKTKSYKRRISDDSGESSTMHHMRKASYIPRRPRPKVFLPLPETTSYRYRPMRRESCKKRGLGNRRSICVTSRQETTTTPLHDAQVIRTIRIIAPVVSF